MPSFRFPLTFLCFSLIAVSTATGRRALEVGVDTSLHNLMDACNSGNYQILNIGFEISLSKTQTPEINLTPHCDSITNGGCTKLSQHIKSCQALGIRLLLSIGDSGQYNHSFTETTNFAAYLWNNFLGGHSNSRQLNGAVLDGVHITNDNDGDSWDDTNRLAKELDKLYKKQGNKFYLSAETHCSSHSIPQPGLFDSISVQYFGNNLICEYLNGGLEGFWDSWNSWKAFSAGKVYVKLLAAPLAEGMGYIPPDVLINEVLPELRRSSKFGGAMLWYDGIDRGYSSEISPKVCGSAPAESLPENDVAMFPMGGDYGGRQGFTNCAGTCVVDRVFSQSNWMSTF